MQTTPESLTGYSLKSECRPLIRPQLILGLLSLVPPKLSTNSGQKEIYAVRTITGTSIPPTLTWKRNISWAPSFIILFHALVEVLVLWRQFFLKFDSRPAAIAPCPLRTRIPPEPLGLSKPLPTQDLSRSTSRAPLSSMMTPVPRAL